MQHEIHLVFQRHCGHTDAGLHFSVRFHIAQDRHHHFVIHPSGQVQVVWHALNSKERGAQ